jgi:hypothetical protein
MVGDNMQFILGLATMLVFFVCLATASYIGYKLGKKKIKSIPITDEETRKRTQFDEHFKALFNYDVSTALKRKR